MRILGFNITRENAGKTAVQKMASPMVQEWLRGDDVDLEGVVLTNAYQQVACVFASLMARERGSRDDTHFEPLWLDIAHA